MRIATLLFLTSAVGLTVATAGTITDYDRTSFQAAVSGLTLENFDEFSSGTVLTTTGGVTYTASLGSVIVTNTYLTTTSPNGLGSTSNGFFGAAETLTLTFATPITAFAIDINTFAPSASGAYQAQVNDDTNSIIQSLFQPFPGFATGQFIGFTDTASFTQLVITVETGYAYTADTMYYGDAAAVTGAVPEPSTVALLGLGLPVIAILVRRRKR